jgi:integrase
MGDVSLAKSLRELIDETAKYMKESGYAEGTINCYKAIWNKLIRYSPDHDYDRKIALLFLQDIFGLSEEILQSSQNQLDRKKRGALRSINVLEDYYYNGSISFRYYRDNDPRRIGDVPESVHDLFYKNYLSYFKSRNPSASWENSTILGLGSFLRHVYSCGIDNPTDISADTVFSFIKATEQWGNPLKATRYKQISFYLQWAAKRGVLSKDYSPLFPAIKRNPPRLPQIWSNDDIEKILGVIDTSNPVGKRNYAVFLIAARTSLRICDVVGMRFSSINWRKKGFMISQYKTTELVSIPMSREIVDALVDYLKFGRPKSDSDYVFLSQRYPYAPLGYHNNFYSAMKQYLTKSGVKYDEGKRIGAHTFRHSATTNMLNNGAELQDVSMIDGHTNIESTKTYVRTNHKQLSLCAIEPE